jgi:hypothetical protein
MTHRAPCSSLRLLLLAAVLAFASLAAATTYPTNICVGTKQKEAGNYCKSALQAWAKWDAKQNATARDAAITKAATKLAAKWSKAETVSQTHGADCVDTTETSADARGFVDSAVGALVLAVNDGLDLGVKADRQCGQKLLAAAAKKCGGLLGVESGYVKSLAKDPKGTKRDAKETKIRGAFVATFSKVIAKGCGTNATGLDVESRVDAIVNGIVTDTIVSPNVDATQFTTITPTGPIKYGKKTLNPICMNGTPYSYFVKRGTVNKLVVYYMGGGACWDNLTCSLPACHTTITPGDSPANTHTGFADATNPLNPFKDWSIVFVSYCGCDIHFGDAAQDYPGTTPIHVEHRGYQNARAVEKWAREHFVNPEEVFVTGSSAGAYGAWFNAPLHVQVWPASTFNVLADAGNGVVTQDFLDDNFPHWNFAGNLPKNVPGLADTLTNGTGIPGYTKLIAEFLPDVRWSMYATAFDGGVFGQTGFYNVMLHPTDLTQGVMWWNASCAWNQKMTQQAQDTAAAEPSNFRYYIGSGSRHTMWGSDKVYSDTTGGVPTILDWVNGMLGNTGGWTNVLTTTPGLTLPGDPAPAPLQPPFVQQGSDVVINCP